jgi:hypothetical protein
VAFEMGYGIFMFFSQIPSFFFQKPILKGTAAGSQQAGKQASQPAREEGRTASQ